MLVVMAPAKGVAKEKEKGRPEQKLSPKRTKAEASSVEQVPQIC